MDAQDLHPLDIVALTADPIDVDALRLHVSDPAAGATVVFLGTVRDHSEGREGVTHLEYEAYEGVVEVMIATVVREARERWPDVLRCAAVHRVGALSIGDVAVCVAVSSPHRRDAFEAGEYLIDEVKARAPIWKKEHWPGGAEWVREDHEHGRGRA